VPYAETSYRFDYTFPESGRTNGAIGGCFGTVIYNGIGNDRRCGPGGRGGALPQEIATALDSTSDEVLQGLNLLAAFPE
jgi:hypothetical protein